MSGSGPMIDCLPAVRAMLLADSSLMAQFTGGDVKAQFATVKRVYGEKLPSMPIMPASNLDTSIPDVLPSTIVYRGSGGTHEGAAGYMWQPRIDLRVYGASEAICRTLWIAVYNSLQQHQGRYAGVHLATVRGTIPTVIFDGFLAAVGIVTFNAIGGNV